MNDNSLLELVAAAAERFAFETWRDSVWEAPTIQLHCPAGWHAGVQGLWDSELRFGVGLIGINHVVGDAESLRKFVNWDTSGVFLLPLCGELVGLFAVGGFVAGGGKYLHTASNLAFDFIMRPTGEVISGLRWCAPCSWDWNAAWWLSNFAERIEWFGSGSKYSTRGESTLWRPSGGQDEDAEWNWNACAIS
jgi:hypothetical protein